MSNPRKRQDTNAGNPIARRSRKPSFFFPGNDEFQEVPVEQKRNSFVGNEVEGDFSPPKRRGLSRKRVFSMDSTLNPLEAHEVPETIIGAIIMALKSLKTATTAEIVQKIEPIFGLLRKENPKGIFKNNVAKSVEGCLENNAEGLFSLNGKSGKWSLRNDSDFGNYFSSLEVKLSRERKRSSVKRRIRKRNVSEYTDIIQKLQGVLDFVSKNEKLARLVQKNPFKKIRKLSRTASQEESKFEEEMLAEMLSSGVGNSEEWLIGILQCFNFFLPLLLRSTDASGKLPLGAAKILTEYIREALAKQTT
jgi:hypothetical protein